MLFDRTQSVHASCEPYSKYIRKAQKQWCHLMVEVSLAWHNTCVRNACIHPFTKQEA